MSTTNYFLEKYSVEYLVNQCEWFNRMYTSITMLDIEECLKHGKVQILFNEYDEIEIKGCVLEGSAPFKEIEVNDIKIIRKLCDLLKIYADIGTSPQSVYQVGEGDSAISYVTYFIIFDRQGFVMEQNAGTYKGEVIALLRNILGEEMNIISSKDEEKIVDIMISHAEY